MKYPITTAAGGKGIPFCCIFIVFFLLLCPPLLISQYKYDQHWVLGGNLGIPEARFNIMTQLSFDSSPPDTLSLKFAASGSAGFSNTTTMSNSQGELIFYSNGCRLYLPNGELMDGDPDLLFGTTFNLYCRRDLVSYENYPTLNQSTVVLPMDDTDSLFYVFYHRQELTRETEFESPWGIISFELYMKEVYLGNNGNYIAGERHLILRQPMGNGFFAAVRDLSPHHWWLIIPPDVYLDNYEAIRVGPEGVDTIITYELNHSEFHPDLDFWNRSQSGQSVVSPDGSLYVRWMAWANMGILLFNFDRATGQLSNPRYLSHPDKPEEGNHYEESLKGRGGASISPNGRFLYINTGLDLFQYDLFAEDIEASKVHIGEFDGFRDPYTNSGLPAYFYLQAMGPDCRIYLSMSNSIRWLHVINHPNRRGLACDFQQHSFLLPGFHRWGLPYHPNYRLDTDYPVCDSTLATSVWYVEAEPERSLFLYPNPAREYALVGWSGIDPVEIWLYDISGREVYYNAVQLGIPDYYFDLAGIVAGVYIVRVRDRLGGVSTGRLVVLR